MAAVARIRRTDLFFDDRSKFKADVFAELKAFDRKCRRNGHDMGIRMNCLSDVCWERVWPSLFRHFPGVSFYDYTKLQKRYQRFLDGRLPDNYHLTWSHRGDLPTARRESLSFLEQGGTVAIVINGPQPTVLDGYPLISGDDDDYRPDDPAGHWVALKAKGPAVHDTTGFVLQTAYWAAYWAALNGEA